jgi:hypothetical protein
LLIDTPTLVLWQNLDYTGIGSRGAAPVRQLSAVAYRIPPGRQHEVVVVAIPYQPGWSLNGTAARPTAQGTIKIHVAGDAGGVLRFGPWRMVAWGYAVSLAVLVLIGMVGLLHKTRVVIAVLKKKDQSVE